MRACKMLLEFFWEAKMRRNYLNSKSTRAVFRERPTERGSACRMSSLMQNYDGHGAEEHI